jgi:hypothetical protein
MSDKTPLATTLKGLDAGILEAEALREDRVRNYAVKFSDGYRCTKDGCPADAGLLVCEVGGGELTSRCRLHVQGRVMPGQWDGRSAA